MLDIILDTLIDGAKLLPFLFITFLIIELIEHKLGSKTKKTISKSGKYGPFFGGLLGLFPQCGFSVMATNLYITRIISIGTLVSVYLATSDEMLPIMISKNVPISMIFIILSIKFAVGMITGFIVDFILRKKETTTYDICEKEHCHCDKGILYSSIVHTLKTVAFIMLITFGLNILFEYGAEDFLSKLLLNDTIFTPLITSLIGLIPSCGASVMITELYLSNIINLGSMIAGLLTGSGVALIVLFKNNKNLKENFLILSIIYGVGVLSGIIIELIEMFI